MPASKKQEHDGTPRIKKPVKACNRHGDCDTAEKEALRKYPHQTNMNNFHCWDDDCEDCFGK